MPLFLSRGIPAGSVFPPFPPFLATHLEAGGLEGEWRLALGLEVRAAIANAPLPVDLLSREELACYRGLPDVSRRAWLTGRAALRRLLRRLDSPSPGYAALLPRPGVALSHSAGTALAAICIDAPGTGLGVDLESHRSLSPGAAGLFLAPEELEELAARNPGSDVERTAAHWLRLKTVKRALLKADPDRRGRGPRDYRLLVPALRRGRAVLRPGLEPREFRYVSHSLEGWRLSLAVAPSATP